MRWEIAPWPRPWTLSNNFHQSRTLAVLMKPLAATTLVSLWAATNFLSNSATVYFTEKLKERIPQCARLEVREIIAVLLQLSTSPFSIIINNVKASPPLAKCT